MTKLSLLDAPFPDHEVEAQELDRIEGVLKPIHDSGQLYALSDFLNYPYFDPYPYPKLMAVLEREGVNRPDPIEIPFACSL